jgi:hypothetical protein
MRTVDPANLQGIQGDMDLHDRIRDKVSGLVSILKDMKTLTPDLEIKKVNPLKQIAGSVEKMLLLQTGVLPWTPFTSAAI